jgi:hypothetical protein
MLPLMLTGCGMNSADGNVVETLAQTRALGAAIATVSDVDSARAVSPAIEGIGRRLAQLAQSRGDLGDLSRTGENIVDNELPAARQDVAQRAALLQLSNPAAARIVGDALTRGTDPSTINQTPNRPYSNLPTSVEDLPQINTPTPPQLIQALQRIRGQ